MDISGPCTIKQSFHRLIYKNPAGLTRGKTATIFPHMSCCCVKSIWLFYLPYVQTLVWRDIQQKPVWSFNQFRFPKRQIKTFSSQDWAKCGWTANAEPSSGFTTVRKIMIGSDVRVQIGSTAIRADLTEGWTAHQKIFLVRHSWA